VTDREFRLIPKIRTNALILCKVGGLLMPYLSKDAAEKSAAKHEGAYVIRPALWRRGSYLVARNLEEILS
jgi:hypothetical protein